VSVGEAVVEFNGAELVVTGPMSVENDDDGEAEPVRGAEDSSSVQVVEASGVVVGAPGLQVVPDEVRVDVSSFVVAGPTSVEFEGDAEPVLGAELLEMLAVTGETGEVKDRTELSVMVVTGTAVV